MQYPIEGIIKTSGSESWSRKIEIMHAHKSNDYYEYLHIITELANTPTNNLTGLIYSLVNDLYKITTESIKLILDVKQFGGQ